MIFFLGWFMFFFFQAEDGIRDHCVTGVQTCALPISSSAVGDGDAGDEAGFAFSASASRAFCAALVAAAEAKSAEVKLRPARMGMRMVEKKFRPTGSSPALAYCFGGAPSTWTPPAAHPPAKSASSE